MALPESLHLHDKPVTNQWPPGLHGRHGSLLTCESTGRSLWHQYNPNLRHFRAVPRKGDWLVDTMYYHLCGSRDNLESAPARQLI